MAERRRPRRPRDPARRVAYDVLRAVDERDAYANLLLPALLDERGITGRDAALATELTYGTLRGRGSYDAVLAACSDRPLAKLDPPVREVLRLGTHQLLGTRVGSHAAVNTSVDLTKEVAGPGPSGFVNAVLRRVATRDLDQWMSVLAPGDKVADLAVRYSYPEWIIDSIAAALDGDLVAALAAGNERPVVTFAAVPGAPLPADASPARWSPYGFTMPGRGDTRDLIATGDYAVQDEASQLAALALARAPLHGDDARWLDMCAGPGGKARLLHGLAAEHGARLAAGELHEHRARLVRKAVGTASAVVADGRAAPFGTATFDRVLLDAPCTGLGALRRRPEARWRKTPADLPGLVALQRDLLRAALELVRPGGVVGYVTCSPVLAETRDVVQDVTGSRDDVEILDAPALLPEVPDLSAAATPRFAQFWPHRHGTDAIFIAVLAKRRSGQPAGVVT
jgi:16S rRNA (cytosine967-C5)-methyltransferase